MTNTPYLIKQNQSLWSDCQITPSRKSEVMLTAKRLVSDSAKEQYISLQNATGVPWFVIAIIHEREASQNFNDSLAQGDPWNRVSTHVPRGRGPFKSFFDAGVDALVNCAPFVSRWKDWTPGGTLTILELYNGTGYEDYHHEVSPYVWGATNHQQWGKYVSDGFSPYKWGSPEHKDWVLRYSGPNGEAGWIEATSYGLYNPHVWDTQLGCAALLIGMMELDKSIVFQDAPVIPVTPSAFDTLWVQSQLNKLGYNLVLDGINGVKTFRVIKDFQVKHNLKVDGIVGPDTIEALKSIGVKALPPPENIQEENFVFDAVKVDIVALEDTIPSLWRGYVDEYLTDAIILHLVKTAITAVDQFRSQEKK
jgi:lysozyme family protein